MADYFLHVDLTVPQENAEAYEDAAKKFLATAPKGGFKRLDDKFDYELVLGLKSAYPLTFTGGSRFECKDRQYTNRRFQQASPAFHFVNLWHLRDLDDLDLADVMTKSSDDPLYIAIDSLVAFSIQDLVLRVQWLATAPKLGEGKRFVRVRRQFNSKDLGTYLFNIGAFIPTLEQNDWHSLGFYQNVTGPLNMVTELWQTKDGSHEVASMAAVVNKVPKGGLRDLVDNSFNNLHQEETRELFVRASYSP
jgi:hypothetical protein